MKVFTSLALAAACLAASPSLAGPAGTGLTFTEEVAKKHQEKLRAAKAKAQAATDCALAKADQPDKPETKSDDPAACRAS